MINMRQIYREVWQDSNGDLIYMEPKNIFSNESKTINLTMMAKAGSP